MRILSNAAVWIAAFIAVGLIVVLVRVPPFGWLPTAGDATELLGTLLTAQAAIAALTLAVTLFVMNGVTTRQDTDDRVFREYVHRSRVQQVFWGSLLAVLATGLVLLSEAFTSEVSAVPTVAPGLRNLTLVAALAFLANLFLAAVLFRQAIHLAHPGQWRSMRRYVNERDVQNAVQAFLRRRKRAFAAFEVGEPSIADAFPGVEEGSANQAIVALLDECRRAMADRRLGDFTLALNSIKDLVTYAMDEMKTKGIKWGPLGTEPEWPPLRELSRNLYSFREEIIRRGERDYKFALVGFDFWLVRSGMRQGCGEMFTIGANGYRWNYQISLRLSDSEFQEIFRERFWSEFLFILSGSEPNEDFPYALEMVRLQEGLLHDAMRANRPLDFGLLHKAFENALRVICNRWNSESERALRFDSLCQQLAQAYRIAVLGLGGRAVILAESGSIPEAAPFLEVLHGIHASATQLANDVAQAVLVYGGDRFYQWSDWDMEGSLDFEVRNVNPRKYPLTSFAIRFMEISNEHMEAPDFHGSAQQVLKWFEENIGPLEKYVRDVPVLGMENRRELAISTLRAAVRKDVVEEDYEIIRRELSPDRVGAFEQGVYEAAFPKHSIESIFQQSGAVLYLPSDSDERPAESGDHQLLLKAHFAQEPEKALIGYGGYRGHQWGRRLVSGLMQQFCEALEDAPQSMASLATSEDLLQTIDGLIEDLNPLSALVIVLAGDWGDVEIELGAKEPEGFESQWRVPEEQQTGDIGRYRGHHVFRCLSASERQLYVVDLEPWGQMVRGRNEEDQDIFVSVKPITNERARELLLLHPAYFPEEADESSKLRKLQTHVEVDVHARTGFRVTDPSRARRVIRTPQENQP